MQGEENGNNNLDWLSNWSCQDLEISNGVACERTRIRLLKGIGELFLSNLCLKFEINCINYFYETAECTIDGSILCSLNEDDLKDDLKIANSI